MNRTYSGELVYNTEERAIATLDTNGMCHSKSGNASFIIISGSIYYDKYNVPHRNYGPCVIKIERMHYNNSDCL